MATDINLTDLPIHQLQSIRQTIDQVCLDICNYVINTLGSSSLYVEFRPIEGGSIQVWCGVGGPFAD